MAKWEYLVFRGTVGDGFGWVVDLIDNPPYPGLESLSDRKAKVVVDLWKFLDRVGSEGWELVSITPSFSRNHGEEPGAIGGIGLREWRGILKRQLP